MRWLRNATAAEQRTLSGHIASDGAQQLDTQVLRQRVPDCWTEQSCTLLDAD